MYVYVCMYIYMYIYIHMQTIICILKFAARVLQEVRVGGALGALPDLRLELLTYIYIYIYIYALHAYVYTIRFV